MGGWHVSERLAGEYARGTVTEPDAWSLETHVEKCGPCAARVSGAVRAGAAGPVLGLVREAVLAETAPRPRPVPAPRPAGVGRAARVMWAAGPALRGSWLLALALVIAGALLLAYGAGFDGTGPLLLALSPALPPAGVALSYGRHADPLYEITAATPSGGLRLLLTRTAAVLVVSVPLLTAAGALLPRSPGGSGAPGPGAWLLPGLALTLAALALGSWIGCRVAASVLAGGWSALILSTAQGAMPGELGAELARHVSGPATQGGFAAAAVVCGALLAVRRSSFDHLERV
ncbi:zf-HC2 domain-containing protein [Streptomyces sp. NPDC001985]|uniref:zf-HC2 domain-containing protein n=1 Tax=Streptomyces sp. NPDC001985 TaxID=3154406 RepID=UPI003330B2B7